ncbi:MULTISPECIES: hypothetical protein [unclassified Nostoc]|uniref:DUF7219 family protein n=1 Tax=unclassified Nostoc TaxID=2593658 RepID=UPI002AD4DABE|nr:MULTISPECIES: hypothetical protein [unclassified Nostoc]MDZ8123204.1 hypothetical protein [Nostoc sp. CmiVER01]MDZ8227906.1 hypothetical protein [Nostoc sp. ChiVER01]
MVQSNDEDKNSFLYPRDRYHGKFQPNNLVFNANLQEFAQKISYITSLETAGKLPPKIAFSQIEALWKQLEDSKNKLGIGSDLSV